MKPIKPLLVLAVILTPAIAAAQGYYGPSGPSRGGPGYYNQPTRVAGGFHDRTGRMTVGGSFGLGGMHDAGGDIECLNCEYNTVSLQGAVHIGGMLNPRLALMGEIQGNAQTLSVSAFPEDDVYLVQSAL